MLTRRVIPCLDLRNGRVVKGVRFADLHDAGSPVPLAERYQAEGADELVLLDVTASAERRGHAVETVRAIRERVAIPLTAGGGVRSVDDAAALLEAGADKVAVNTAACRSPGLLDALAGRFGSQCVTLSIDVRATGGRWQVHVVSGSRSTAIEAIDWMQVAVQRGAGEILLTSIDRDGTGSGFDLDLLTAASRAVAVPIVASGGARSAAHCVAAIEAGADAVLAASMFHRGWVSVADTKRALHQAGFEVRP